jgi:hypothetical protein
LLDSEHSHSIAEIDPIVHNIAASPPNKSVGNPSTNLPTIVAKVAISIIVLKLKEVIGWFELMNSLFIRLKQGGSVITSITTDV